MRPIADRARCSAADAYLHPARVRPNLTIHTHANATKIDFSGKRAIGVEYLRFGEVETAHASCEVVLCAGALRSPKLLMLSGIGPGNGLERLGITVRQDLPGVGRNLQDHLHTRVRCEITQPLTFGALPDGQKADSLRAYEANRDNTLVSNFLEAGAFVKSEPGEAYPGLQLFFLAMLSPDYPEGGPPRRHGITLTSYINRPSSRGEMTLASADPLDRPVEGATPADKAQYNFTDPESRIMKGPDGFVQAYNTQIVVDAASQLIVGQAVTQETNDKQQLQPIVTAAQRELGTVLANSGYCSDANLQAMTDARIDAYIATARDKHGAAVPRCPRGPLPKTATPTDRMRRKLQTKRGQAIYRLRKTIVEPVFGQIKQARGFRQFLLRGVEKVRSEWALVCMTHNILKLYRCCGT